MGYVFSFKDAVEYEKALNRPKYRFLLELEQNFFLKMLKPAPGQTILDIGCGTGANISAMIDSGLSVIGIDPSPYMLDIARKKLKDKASFRRGFAESLPFEDNSFNHACLIATLEFAEETDKALEEACRVAKDKIFIGYLNRYAFAGIWRRISGIFSPTVYNHAKFFGAWELKWRILRLMGDIPVSCRTTGQLPVEKSKTMRRIESSKIFQMCPFGAFGGIVAVLVPRYRTRPLPLSLSPAKSEGSASGYMSEVTTKK